MPWSFQTSQVWTAHRLVGSHLELERKGHQMSVQTASAKIKPESVSDVQAATEKMFVDDDQAPVADWLPALAQTLGAEAPTRVPLSTARQLAGEAGVVMMTEIRGASNPKAKRELAWLPAHPSWRQGFVAT
jgi:hypothetical protein